MEWMEIIGNSTDQKAVINVPSWLSRATLDAIGQGTTVTAYDRCISHFLAAAFDVQFGAIKDDSHPLVKAYNNFLSVLWHLLRSHDGIMCFVQE